MNRWLDKNQYRQIHAKAKKLGANSVDTKHLSHCAYWKNFKVYFAFKPFKCMLASINTIPVECNDIALIQTELSNVQEFVDYLKKFNKNLVEGDMTSV
jgi:hypothetical protein